MIELILILILIVIINQIIYDKYVQRKSSLLINYPLIGRMRYFFELLREPLRQYFGEEKFFDSRDKIDWVYKAAKNVPNFISFSISQPFPESRFIFKHSNIVLNEDEVSDDMSVTFGERRELPFVAKSPIIRSAMSDGALSPEAIRAFTKAALLSGFPLNTGEGGLSSNFFFMYELDEHQKCFEIYEANEKQKKIFKFISYILNGALATKFFKRMMLGDRKDIDTFILDRKKMALFRPNWSAPLEDFPTTLPKSMPDIIFQIGSGLYGVRDGSGEFDDERYKKVMSFCAMSEIKIAQGAKQTGGKLVGNKVSEDIAYYRGVEAHKDLMSPNRFKYASSYDELFDFIGKAQKLSKKPVGIKIVISDFAKFDEMIKVIEEREKEGKAIPDFITIDGGDGGSATAPLELMEGVGLTLVNALFLADWVLKDRGVRDKIKIVASGKVLTPDDVVTTLSLGADSVGIARGFMMSGGCIRARYCAGTGKHVCPIGLATQDKKKRASYLVLKKSEDIANYHNNLKKGIKTLLAVLGKKRVDELSQKNLSYKNRDGQVYFDINHFFKSRFYT